MKTFDLSGKIRESLGKKEAKKLRSEKKVPCVLYGAEQPVHFYCEEGALHKLIYTPNVYLINLDIDGSKSQAIMQDIQFDPVTDKPIHIDFLTIKEDKPVKINIPVKVEGYAKGMRAGGKLQLEIRYLTVSALPKNLPDTITIDVSDLDIGQSYRVGDIETDTLKILNVKSIPVVRVAITRASRATEETPQEEAE